MDHHPKLEPPSSPSPSTTAELTLSLLGAMAERGRTPATQVFVLPMSLLEQWVKLLIQDRRPLTRVWRLEEWLNTPDFRAWVHRVVAEMKDDVGRRVDLWLTKGNLKTEVQDSSGRWIEE